MGYWTNKLKTEGKALESIHELKGKRAKDLLISIKTEDDHIHAVLPNDKKVKEELIEDLKSDIELPIKKIVADPPSEVTFKNRQAIGDILTFTCAVRDFKNAFPSTRVGVISTAMHIWDNNPYIDHQFKDNVVEIGPGIATNRSNRLNHHMCNAYRFSIEDKLGLSIPQGPLQPDIWLTEEEVNRKPVIDGDPYWVFIPNGAPGWPAKKYHRWEEVIDGLKNDIRIVQLGIKGQFPLLPGAEDFIGKTQDRETGIRDLFNIFYHAQGSLSLVSMAMHLSGAFGNPAVVVAGAREPFWFTNYFNHQYLSTNGCLPCATKACWACKLEGCRNLVDKTVPKCVDIIHPDEVIRAVRRYYDGGILEYGKKKPITFSNVVKEKKVFVAPTTDDVDEKLLKEYGFEWGGGAITDKDWIFIKELIQKEKIKTILEFGTGLSTLLFQTQVDKIDSFETQQGWINKISQFTNDKIVTHHLWDGKTAKIPQEEYDLTFMDGPAGGGNREYSTMYCAKHSSKFVIVHDAGRAPEREWQEKHLTKDYELYRKGGHRCHLWRKKERIEIDHSKPTIRFVSTMRGYGGSERSTLELMKGFINSGYNVEYIPTGNICGPYLNDIPDGAIQREWKDIITPCDILMLYCSDTIWSYRNPEWNILNDLKAKRKVMCVNYKVGDVGVTDWTKSFDKYMFLNRELEEEVQKRIPGCNTIVLPPPTNLTDFFTKEIDYSGKLRIIRHSSQRDAKWPDYTNELITKINNLRDDIEFYFMPPRSDCLDLPNIHKFKVNQIPVPDFLEQGNVFWYILPPNYTEGGPRVVLEAMSCGLPCIVDNHSGMKDRVTTESGWKCDDEYQMLDVIKNLTEEELRRKGMAAKERAREHFTIEKWIKEIEG